MKRFAATQAEAQRAIREQRFAAILQVRGTAPRRLKQRQRDPSCSEQPFHDLTHFLFLVFFGHAFERGTQLTLAASRIATRFTRSRTRAIATNSPQLLRVVTRVPRGPDHQMRVGGRRLQHEAMLASWQHLL
jgi:hypothetical protein